MIHGELKKEFYFTNDVFRKVSKELGISEAIVKDVFNHFLTDFKQEILDTDYLFYGLRPLGVLSINKKDLNKNIRKFTTKFYKETDKEEKAKLKKYLDNFKMREKRMRVEDEKFKVIYPEKISKTFLKKSRNAMFKPSKFEARYYTNSVNLEESSRLQNEYAQNWYKKHNKPVAH